MNRFCKRNVSGALDWLILQLIIENYLRSQKLLRDPKKELSYLTVPWKFEIYLTLSCFRVKKCRLEVCFVQRPLEKRCNRLQNSWICGYLCCNSLHNKPFTLFSIPQIALGRLSFMHPHQIALSPATCECLKLFDKDSILLLDICRTGFKNVYTFAL